MCNCLHFPSIQPIMVFYIFFLWNILFFQKLPSSCHYSVQVLFTPRSITTVVTCPVSLPPDYFLEISIYSIARFNFQKVNFYYFVSRGYNVSLFLAISRLKSSNWFSRHRQNNFVLTSYPNSCNPCLRSYGTDLRLLFGECCIQF